MIYLKALDIIENFFPDGEHSGEETDPRINTKEFKENRTGKGPWGTRE